MVNYKKIVACISAVGMCMSFAACSDTENVTPEKELSAEEINSRYDELMSSAQEITEELPQDYNPITDSFTTVDFQFTMTDNTVAFNLPENSYTKITPSGAYFNFIATENPGETFEGSFQTAKGISLANTLDEFIASYKIAPEYLYVPQAGTTVLGFFSADGLNYAVLSADQVQTVVDMRNASSAGEDIVNTVPEAVTVAIVELTAAEDGTMSEYATWRFDKINS